MKEKIKIVLEKSTLLSRIGTEIYYFYLKLKKDDNYKTLLKYSNKKKIIKDMIFSHLHYKVKYSEYWLYNFEDLNETGKKKYVSESEKNTRVMKISPENVRNILKDKYQCYCKLQKYYKRSLIKIDSNEKEKFLNFCQTYSDIFIKPYDGSLGAGVIKVSKNDDYTKIYEDIEKTKETFVLEELIEQSNVMSKFHPQSINTVRFATLNDGKTVHNLFAFLRIGCGDSIVDNLAAGGISAAIDIETGIITTSGKNEECEVFIKHPDTGTQIVGFNMPNWNEVLKMVQEMAKEIPDCKYIAWDLAHTDKGWCLVEANSRGVFDGIQMHGRRLRDEFEKYFN